MNTDTIIIIGIIGVMSIGIVFGYVIQLLVDIQYKLKQQDKSITRLLDLSTLDVSSDTSKSSNDDFDSMVCKYTLNSNYTVRVINDLNNLPQCDLVIYEYLYGYYHCRDIRVTSLQAFKLIIDNTKNNIANVACVSYTDEYRDYLNTTVTNGDLIKLKLIDE